MTREGKRAPQTVSVIIPAYNAAPSIGDQLQALEKQTYPGEWEIVVVDNRSTDGTAGIVRAWCSRLPRLRLVAAHRRAGAAYARNVGVEAASGDLLAFCDADDVVDPCWLERLVLAAGSWDAVGGGIDLHLLNDPPVVQWRAGQSADERLRTSLEFLPFAVTSNLAVWRDAFEEAGGLPAYEGAAGEDVAFCWNLQLAGRQLGLEPTAVVHLRCRQDLGSLMRQFHRYGIAQARLYKEYRVHGARRRTLRAVVKTAMMLVLDVRHAVRDRGARGRWAREVAFEAGQLRGAWRHRVLFAG